MLTLKDDNHKYCVVCKKWIDGTTAERRERRAGGVTVALLEGNAMVVNYLRIFKSDENYECATACTSRKACGTLGAKIKEKISFELRA